MKFFHGIAGFTRSALFAAAAVSLLVSGCAYYNTLYNAKKKFNEAEKVPRDRSSGTVSRGQTVAYDDVITRCQTMIGTYPGSRHVDDAMFLIARSLFSQDRFLEAAAQCDSLESKFPKTDLLPRVRFLKGRALAGGGECESAIVVLQEGLEKFRGDDRPFALYYLATCSVTLGHDDAAVAYVDRLQKKYGNSDHTFDAQVEIAAILLEKKLYDRSLTVYRALDAQRLPSTYRYQIWIGLARASLRSGDNEGAIATVARLRTLPLKPDQEAATILVGAEAYAAVDSTDRATAEYHDITARFSRGQYAAEAHFHLGDIYENMDSLARAKQNFEAVPRAYAGSEYATDAIRRAGNISRLLKLEETAGDDSPEARMLREFTMAELQLTQLNTPKKALEGYQRILADFPDSEYGPRAAYAVGYIYSVVLPDSVKAEEAYRYLQERYPDSQQSEYVELLRAAARNPVLRPPAPEEKKPE